MDARIVCLYVSQFPAWTISHFGDAELDQPLAVIDARKVIAENGTAAVIGIAVDITAKRAGAEVPVEGKHVVLPRSVRSKVSQS